MRKQRGTSAEEEVMLVLGRLRVVLHAVRQHFRAIERQAGWSGAEVWALSVVQQQPGLGVNELARAMHVHQSTASNLLRGLTQGGLVRSRRAGEDRRTVQLEVTARGQRVLAKALPPLTGVLPRALERLEATTLARLGRDLGRLVDQLGPDGGEEEDASAAAPRPRRAAQRAVARPSKRARPAAGARGPVRARPAARS